MKVIFQFFLLLFLFSFAAQAQEQVINLNQMQGETIVLDYDKNDFVIEYVGIHFDASSMVQYQYKMEGFHDDWQKVGTERKARFNNLSPGKYTFLVKAANPDGIWNETPATLNFKILAPWYWTWWSKLIYGCLLLWFFFFIYWYDYYRRLAKSESERLEQLIVAQQHSKVNGKASASSDTTPKTNPSNKDKVKNVFLDKIKIQIELHLDDSNYSVENLAKDMNLSRQQLYRKTKSLTGKSVASYVRLIRLHHGKQLLQTTDLNVSEVAYQVGFSDPSYFSKSYSEEFGYAPMKEQG
ncbi:MAG: AraC-like DNA-binding protein [Granulosicoccus sp.]|jgi:AraC-like DNA-binding protein